MTPYAKMTIKIALFENILHDRDADASAEALREIKHDLGACGNAETNFETGTCDYAVVYRVTSNTSGDELLGPTVDEGEFSDELSAATFLANKKGAFTRTPYGSWIGNNGYTRANITRMVRYGFK